MRDLLRLAVCVAPLAAMAPRQLPAQEPTTVILVRHAERSAEAGADPGLSSAGVARAAALAEALVDARVSAIVTSQFRRAQETAAPLARALGLTPEVVQAGGGVSTAAHVTAVADLIRGRYLGRTVLVVGHSNTVPAIVTALGGPVLQPLCEGEFANLFVLTLRGDGASLVRGTVGANDPPSASDCRRPAMDR